MRCHYKGCDAAASHGPEVIVTATKNKGNPMDQRLVSIWFQFGVCPGHRRSITIKDILEHEAEPGVTNYQDMMRLLEYLDYSAGMESPMQIEWDHLGIVIINAQSQRKHYKSESWRE